MTHPGHQFDAQTLHAATASSPDILRFIEAKAPREIHDWNELGGAEYARAFTAAKTAGYGVVGDLYEAFLRVTQQGGTEEDYARLVLPILREKGWLADQGGNIGHRVRLIYDTNLRVARGVGRWQRVQSVAHVMPYLLGSTVGDNRVREAHTHFQGIVLPVGHWFWREFWPPMYFMCRCDVIQLTRSQFLKRKLIVTPEAEVVSRAAMIRPQSWGYNAALEGAKATEAMLLSTNENLLPGQAPMIPADAEGKAAWQRIMGMAVSELLSGLARALWPL